jgi:serine/threonine protein kinase
MRRPSIPGYELGGKLGAGAFGRVYRAVQLSTGAVVAVKVVDPLPETTKSLLREVQALNHQLDNPYVVRLYAYDLDAPMPYVVMEFCEGGTLAEWGEKERPWRHVAAVVLHAAAGLCSIHEAGGFHRDIKPHNLLLTSTERGLQVKLGDFGLSRIPNAGASVMTASPGGTPEYWAPEIGRAIEHGEPVRFTAAADVYSLGVTAIELLTGSRQNVGLTTRRCPDSLKRLLMAMVHSNPTQRPTARDVADALTTILHADAEQQADAQRAQPVRRRHVQREGLLPLLLAGATLIAGFAVIAAFHEDDND